MLASGRHLSLLEDCNSLTPPLLPNTFDCNDFFQIDPLGYYSGSDLSSTICLVDSAEPIVAEFFGDVDPMDTHQPTLFFGLEYRPNDYGQNQLYVVSWSASAKLALGVDSATQWTARQQCLALESLVPPEQYRALLMVIAEIDESVGGSSPIIDHYLVGAAGTYIPVRARFVAQPCNWPPFVLACETVSPHLLVGATALQQACVADLHANVCQVATDLNGRFVWVSPTCSAVFHIHPLDLIGQSSVEFMTNIEQLGFQLHIRRTPLPEMNRILHRITVLPPSSWGVAAPVDQAPFAESPVRFADSTLMNSLGGKLADLLRQTYPSSFGEEPLSSAIMASVHPVPVARASQKSSSRNASPHQSPQPFPSPPTVAQPNVPSASNLAMRRIWSAPQPLITPGDSDAEASPKMIAGASLTPKSARSTDNSPDLLMRETMDAQGWRWAQSSPTGNPASPKQRSVYRPSKRTDKMCEFCGRRESPEWRRGPSGPNSLCNACGIRHAKLRRSANKSTSTPPLTPQQNLTGSLSSSPVTAPAASVSQPVVEAAPIE